MRNYLGLDVGTTTVTAIVVDAVGGDVVGKATAPNDAETTSAEDRRLGRSEWDPNRILSIARDVLREAASDREVAAVGVTGQMHGMLLVEEDGEPAGPFIGWQDQRAAEGEVSPLSELTRAVEETDGDGHVCRAKAGYLGATLLWLKRSGNLTSGATACFLPDFLSAHLTSTQPVTDATNGAGSGLFDVAARSWHTPLLDRLGFTPDLLPSVQASGSQAGTLSPGWSDTGLDTGIPVSVACGDNQASFLGSVSDPENAVLINVGTGGQVSVSADTADMGPGLEGRPHVDGKYILVGAGLVGGRTYAWLRDFYLAVGRDVFGVDGDGDAVYERMTELAVEIQSDVDGLTFEPLFTGTREDPARRGLLTGIGTANFSPGHLSRALQQGVIDQFKGLYEQALAVGAGERSQLVGAGNGIRKNPVLRGIAETTFGMSMSIPRHTEEAAYGAAMLAMVLGGARKDLADAREAIRYIED